MTDLLSRLSAATGPSRELDAEIALACGWKHYVPCDGDNPDLDYWRSPTGQICPDPPRYTESIDAAMTLVPEGHCWAIDCVLGIFAAAVKADERYIGDNLSGPGASYGTTPAIALVIACLKARMEKDNAGQ